MNTSSILLRCSQAQLYRGLYLSFLFYGTSLIWGCDPPAPHFLELSAPRGSIDPLGPYAFSAKVAGAVDQVSVIWKRVEPSRETREISLADFEDAERFPLDLEGGIWRGELEGGTPLARYYYYFEATGPGGQAREPTGGLDFFEVNALGERCLNDQDCLEDELCHREDLYCFVPPSPCGEDAHCPRDRVCNLDTGLCRFSDLECETDAQCESGERCEGGSCIDEVIDPPPPPPPPMCDPPCIDGERCIEGLCVMSQECTADGQCGEGATCDLSLGLCVTGERGVFCEPCTPLAEPGSPFACGVGFGCIEGLPGCRPQCGSRGPNEPLCDEGERCESGVCIRNAPDFRMCSSDTCFNNSECPSGSCHYGRCTVIQRCEEDADCKDSMRCESGRCIQPDACEPHNCAPNEICLGGTCKPRAIPTSSCDPCRFDSDCRELSHCYYDLPENEGRCVTMCQFDGFCGEEQRCLTENGMNGYCGEELICPATATCETLDRFEPNDLMSQATSLPLPESGSLTYDELALCQRDDDIFHLTPMNSLRYTIKVVTEAPAMLYLLDDEGSLITEIPNVFPISEGVSFELNQNRFLQIVGLDERSTPYSITATVIPPIMVVCESDDSLEDNDLLSQSYPIGAGADLTLALCPADEDWFTFRGRVGDRWTFNLFLREFTGGVELSIGRSSDFEAGSPASWYFLNHGDQSVEYLLEQSEPHYLRLRCEDCLTSIRYQLSLSRQ